MTTLDEEHVEQLRRWEDAHDQRRSDAAQALTADTSTDSEHASGTDAALPAKAPGFGPRRPKP